MRAGLQTCDQCRPPHNGYSETGATQPVWSAAQPQRKGSQVACFEHYMYVLECGDGSLYTGYITDVAARVWAYQSGTGAKYTRSHEPVQHVARARFYSKWGAPSDMGRPKLSVCMRRAVGPVLNADGKRKPA